MPINSMSKLILLVDDDSDIVNLFKDLLENKNCEVIGFTNPLEALEHYKTNCNRYGLVISGIRMPGMSGVTFFGLNPISLKLVSYPYNIPTTIYPWRMSNLVVFHF
jgi:response regulator RpfG family c-di-GMP phosphodiesterase